MKTIESRILKPVTLKILIFLLISLPLIQTLKSQNVAISDDNAYKADSSAMLDVKSVTKGFLVPRLTTIQRNAINKPANGLLIFDTDLKTFVFFSDSKWSNISYVGGLWSTGNKLVYLSDSTMKVGVGTSSPSGKFEIRSDQGAGPDDPLFEVKDQDGNVVFGVYPSGVKVFFEEGLSKASKGGFAVGGRRRSTKGPTNPYLFINEDSVRIYINDTTKKSKGGFAVGGRRGSAKDGATDILSVTGDSVRIYLNDTTTAKASKGGFAVGGRRRSAKGNGFDDYLRVTPDSTRIFVTDSTNGLAVTNLKTGKSPKIFNINSKNTMIGEESGSSLISNGDAGSYNSFIGFQSGRNTISGRRNVAIGYQSGLNNNMDYNIFIGNETGKFNNGNYNNFIGYLAGQNNTTGNSNTFIGINSGKANTTGAQNVFIGPNSGTNNRNANYNIFIGYNSGSLDTSGGSNVCIGYRAGMSNRNGSKNIFIGNDAGYSETGSEKLYISNSNTVSPLIYGDFATGYVKINGFLAKPVGTAVTSSSTIIPSGPIFHVTGTTQITTINLPYTGFTGSITIIPDGVFSTITGGNIAIATTAIVSRAIIFTYDGTKWYPSY